MRTLFPLFIFSILFNLSYGQGTSCMDTVYSTNPFSNAFFGGISSIDQDRMAVSETFVPLFSGTAVNSVHVYDWDGSAWNGIKLSPSSGQNDIGFGPNEIEGDNLVVGARLQDINNTNQGAVYVYAFDGTNWNETILTASDGVAYDFLGGNVAISGNRIIARASGDQNNGNEGSLYVFEYNGTNWIEVQKFESQVSGYSNYAADIAIDGNTIVAGSENTHRIYIYEYNGSSWTTQVITGPIGDDFGSSVDISNGKILVGAPLYNSATLAGGAVYMYEKQNGSWVNTNMFTPNEIINNCFFGSDVAIYDDKFIVGARQYDYNGIDNVGAIFFYEYDGSNWNYEFIPNNTNSSFEQLGANVEIHGNTWVAGVTSDNDLFTNSGAVYTNRCSCQGTTAPVVICKDITVDVSISNSVTITPMDIDNGSSDDCEISNMTLNQSTFSCVDLGTINVTLTVFDNDGNSSSCSAVVTVINSQNDCGSCHPDYEPMVAIYNSLGGASWTNNTGWIDGAAGTDCDVCNWYGVSCFLNGRVRRIDLDGTPNDVNNGGGGNNCVGTIPPEINGLTEIEILTFSSNSGITGSIPSEIGDLTSLENLYITSCNLTGSIPAEIGNCTNLERIQFGSNNLTGSIPPEIANCSFLDGFWVNLNNLTGTIPAEFANQNTLQAFWVEHNNLSGCFDQALQSKCSQWTNVRIDNGNNFDALWADFCSNGDGVCVPCPTNLTESSNPITDDFYQAELTLTSAGVVPANGTVVFGATTICLENGFEVTVTGDFEAKYDPCAVSP